MENKRTTHNIIFRVWEMLENWQSTYVVRQPGPIVTLYLPFLHAWSGCDTISTTHVDWPNGKARTVKGQASNCKVDDTTFEKVEEVWVSLCLVGNSQTH